MPPGADFDALEVYWADVLGCTRADLRRDRTVLVPHGKALRCENMIWVLRRGAACVVSVPAPMVRALSPLASRHAPAEWFDRQFLLDVLRHPVRGVVGPVSLFSADVAASHSIVPGQQAAPGRLEWARYYAVLLKSTWP